MFAVITWAIGLWQLANNAPRPPRERSAHSECGDLEPDLFHEPQCPANDLSLFLGPVDPEMTEAVRQNDTERIGRLRAQAETRARERQRQCFERDRVEQLQARADYDACVVEASTPERVAIRRNIYVRDLAEYTGLIALRLAWIAIVPVLVALAFMGLYRVGRWIWRGFQQSKP